MSNNAQEGHGSSLCRHLWSLVCENGVSGGRDVVAAGRTLTVHPDVVARGSGFLKTAFGWYPPPQPVDLGDSVCYADLEAAVHFFYLGHLPYEWECLEDPERHFGAACYLGAPELLSHLTDLWCERCGPLNCLFLGHLARRMALPDSLRRRADLAAAEDFLSLVSADGGAELASLDEEHLTSLLALIRGYLALASSPSALRAGVEQTLRAWLTARSLQLEDTPFESFLSDPAWAAAGPPRQVLWFTQEGVRRLTLPDRRLLDVGPVPPCLRVENARLVTALDRADQSPRRLYALRGPHFYLYDSLEGEWLRLPRPPHGRRDALMTILNQGRGDETVAVLGARGGHVDFFERASGRWRCHFGLKMRERPRAAAPHGPCAFVAVGLEIARLTADPPGLQPLGEIPPGLFHGDSFRLRSTGGGLYVYGPSDGGDLICCAVDLHTGVLYESSLDHLKKEMMDRGDPRCCLGTLLLNNLWGDAGLERLSADGWESLEAFYRAPGQVMAAAPQEGGPSAF